MFSLLWRNCIHLHFAECTEYSKVREADFERFSDPVGENIKIINVLQVNGVDGTERLFKSGQQQTYSNVCVGFPLETKIIFHQPLMPAFVSLVTSCVGPQC